MTARRRAKAWLWEKVEGRHWLGFWRLESGPDGVGWAAQAAGGYAAETRPVEPNLARLAPVLADRTLVARTRRTRLRGRR